jgi:hypothetical protein
VLGDPAATQHGAVRVGHPAAAEHGAACFCHSPAAPDRPVSRDDPGRCRPGEEPNRVLGFPVGTGGRSGGGRSGGEEPQHVMGMPVDWFESVNPGPLRALAHPLQRGWRWLSRQGGPDEAEP